MRTAFRAIRPALYDLVFHLVLGAAFVAALRARLLRGRLFAIHLALYGVFRFAIEPLRDTRPYLGPFTAYRTVHRIPALCRRDGGLRRLGLDAAAPFLRASRSCRARPVHLTRIRTAI
jgi:hypothetical protein